MSTTKVILRALPAAGMSTSLAGLFVTSLAPALIQMAAFHHSLCAAGLPFSEIVALHASAGMQFMPLVMLASGMSAAAVMLWSDRKISVAKILLALLSSPLLVAGGCWIAQIAGTTIAGHALLMTMGMLAAVGLALLFPNASR